MKKILFALLAACCVWAAWDATRPTEKYVVKATACEGDTLWHLSLIHISEPTRPY